MSKYFDKEYETGNGGDEYGKYYYDKLEKYLHKWMDVSNLSDNPFAFSENHKTEFSI